MEDGKRRGKWRKENEVENTKGAWVIEGDKLGMETDESEELTGEEWLSNQPCKAGLQSV